MEATQIQALILERLGAIEWYDQDGPPDLIFELDDLANIFDLAFCQRLVEVSRG